VIDEKGFYSYIDAFMNFIYPRNIFCIVCGASITKTEKYSMCYECREKTPFITAGECEKCGKPLESLYLPSECPDCIRGEHLFDRGYSCVEYNEQMKQLVYKLKYGKQRYIAYHLAEIMSDKLIKIGLENIDVIIPVPLHKKKLREREFNQAQLISKYIAKARGWHVEDKNLIRTKMTLSQNKLSKDERKDNVKNAFLLTKKEELTGKNILLVDDIYTTGSTFNACCKELQKAKPKAIHVITFTTGRNV